MGVKLDSIQNFSGRANDYTVGRPHYAEPFIEYLYAGQKLSEQSVIADIGSGTGKFAKQLLKKGSTVFCVEPNDDMRKASTKELDEFENCTIINGTASETKLRDSSVDFVTTAQAFHWFEVEEFRKECQRILKPQGKVALIWNMRDMSAAVNSDSYKIYAQFCPQFKGFGGE